MVSIPTFSEATLNLRHELSFPAFSKFTLASGLWFFLLGKNLLQFCGINQPFYLVVLNANMRKNFPLLC